MHPINVNMPVTNRFSSISLQIARKCEFEVQATNECLSVYFIIFALAIHCD